MTPDIGRQLHQLVLACRFGQSQPGQMNIQIKFRIIDPVWMGESPGDFYQALTKYAGTAQPATHKFVPRGIAKTWRCIRSINGIDTADGHGAVRTFQVEKSGVQGRKHSHR